MSYLKTFFIGVILTFGLANFSYSQNNFGYINIQQLVSDMPESKAAQSVIKNLEQKYRADLENSAKELQNLYTKYQNESAMFSEEENERRAEDIRQRELNIRQAEQSAGQELQKKQMELLEPIFNKANNAVQKVAIAQGVNYVLDSSAGSGLIYTNGNDLMQAVKSELGF